MHRPTWIKGTLLEPDLSPVADHHDGAASGAIPLGGDQDRTQGAFAVKVKTRIRERVIRCPHSIAQKFEKPLHRRLLGLDRPQETILCTGHFGPWGVEQVVAQPVDAWS